jgi:hypothetical protein
MGVAAFRARSAEDQQRDGIPAKMTIRFPNVSRFYSPTRDAVRFWGYDQSTETSFYISSAALQQIAPGTVRSEEALLAAFDRNRPRILEAATKIYGHGRLGISYDLNPADF